jgi:hypothetical protein
MVVSRMIGPLPSAVAAASAARVNPTESAGADEAMPMTVSCATRSRSARAAPAPRGTVPVAAADRCPETVRFRLVNGLRADVPGRGAMVLAQRHKAIVNGLYRDTLPPAEFRISAGKGLGPLGVFRPLRGIRLCPGTGEVP